jgi:phosphohistidine phosphatase
LYLYSLLAKEKYLYTQNLLNKEIFGVIIMRYLFLARHGMPVSKEVDLTKPLSEEGKREVEKVAKFFAESPVRPGVIYHSGKKRAVQTAEIIHEKLKLDKVPLAKEGISPLDSPGIIAEEIDVSDSNLMIVGHLPHLSRLASWLVTGNDSEAIVDFKQGAVLCLQKDDKHEKWLVSWLIAPDLLKV